MCTYVAYDAVTGGRFTSCLVQKVSLDQQVAYVTARSLCEQNGDGTAMSGSAGRTVLPVASRTKRVKPLEK